MGYTLEVGLFAPTIREQLNSQNVYMKISDYEKYEKLRKSIHMVVMHDMFTEPQVASAWKKFYKKIEQDIYNDIKIETM
jgi:hypothetical protein